MRTPLPEVGDLVPKVDGIFIENNGKTFFKCKTSQIPTHDLVRITWRLWLVGEYVAMLDAWVVTPFTIDTSDEAIYEWIASGD